MQILENIKSKLRKKRNELYDLQEQRQEKIKYLLPIDVINSKIIEAEKQIESLDCELKMIMKGR